MHSRFINDKEHGYWWVVNHVGVSCGWTPTEAHRVIQTIILVATGGLMAGDTVFIKGFAKIYRVGSGQGKALRMRFMGRALARLLWSVDHR